MADLGTIGIAIEVRGREALRQIENDMTLVDRSAKSAARSFEVFERAGLKTAETFRYVSDAAKKRLSDEERITRELIKQRDAAEQLAKANAQAFQSQIGPNLGLGAKGISAGGSASAMEAEIERLRQKYDKIYASSQLYEASLKELNQAHLLGVTSTKQHEEAVERLNAEYQAFQNGAALAGNRFAEHVNQSATGVNQFGVVVQQAGYQIGDFLVQVQSGTNWMVALGQQATQLVGVLPLMGAGFMGLSSGALVALSAGLGIAIPLVTALGAAWLRTTEDVKTGASQMETLLKTLQQESENLRQKWSELKFGNIAGQTIEDLKNQASALRAEIESLTTQASESVLRPFINLQGYSIEQKKQELQLLVDQLNALEEVNRKNQEKAAQLEKANAINNQMLAVELAHARAIGDAKREQESMTKAAQSALDKYSKMRTVAAGVASVDIEKGILAAAAAAANLARELGISLGLANRIMELGGEVVFDPRDPRYDPVVAEMMRLKEEAGTVSPFDPSRQETDTSSKSGGAGGNARIDSLINQLQTEREVVNEWYAESQETLMSASEAELAILGGYNEAKLRLEQEYQERLKGIRDEYNGTALGDAATFFGGMADIARAGGDKTVKAMRIFSAAQALINSYVAFTEVLKDPSFIGRPWARFGAAASALSSGLAAVASIKSGSGGSIGSGGGGRGSAVVSAAASDPTPQTVMIDSIDPDSLYSGQTLINLFDAFYNENDKRGKVFVVAR